MTEIEKITKGLRVIELSRPKTESPFHVRAEHDQLFAGSLNWNMREVDKQRLNAWGWQEVEDVDGWVFNL